MLYIFCINICIYISHYWFGFVDAQHLQLTDFPFVISRYGRVYRVKENGLGDDYI